MAMCWRVTSPRFNLYGDNGIIYSDVLITAVYSQQHVSCYLEGTESWIFFSILTCLPLTLSCYDNKKMKYATISLTEYILLGATRNGPRSSNVCHGGNTA